MAGRRMKVCKDPNCIGPCGPVPCERRLQRGRRKGDVCAKLGRYYPAMETALCRPHARKVAAWMASHRWGSLPIDFLYIS